MTGVPFNSPLQQFHREGELFVKIADSRGEPCDEPVSRGQQQRLFETIIGSLFFASEQDISAREPDVRRIAALFDGSIGKRERALKIAAAAQSNRFGGEKLGLVRESFEGFIGPKP